MKQAFINGGKVLLRGIEREDLTNLMQWMNDSDVTHFLFMGDRPVHLEQLTEQYQKQINASDEVSLAIVEKKKNKIIGWCGLYRINWISRHGEYRVFIGEKRYWNKGIGSEIAKLLIGYGFEKLNLNKIWLGVNSSHKGASCSYKKAGFIKEGLLRQEIYRNGQYYDAVRMSILRKEYNPKI